MSHGSRRSRQRPALCALLLAGAGAFGALALAAFHHAVLRSGGNRDPCSEVDEPAGRRRDRDGGAGRRLLLGRAGRVPACRRREERRLRLCRRRREDARNTRWSAAGKHRPCRSGRDHLRPDKDQLRQAAADLFLGRARSDRAEPAGAGRRHAVPLGDLPAERGAGEGRQGLYRAARRRRGSSMPRS